MRRHLLLSLLICSCTSSDSANDAPSDSDFSSSGFDASGVPFPGSADSDDDSEGSDGGAPSEEENSQDEGSSADQGSSSNASEEKASDEAEETESSKNDSGDDDEGSTPPEIRYDVFVDGDSIIEPVPESIPRTCADALAGNSNVGCEFYGVDLDNDESEGYGELPYGIAFSNVQENQNATVVVERKIDGAWETVAGPVDVAPLSLETVDFDNVATIGGGVQPGLAYRVTSDVPIIAYQFNPLDGVSSFSSDASMLLPSPAWDYLYQMVGYKVSVGARYPSYFVVVASKDGTEVEITPSAASAAGTNLPAGIAGTPFSVELDEGDIVELQTVDGVSSFTGSTITSDEEHPIAVFSGTDCSYLPIGSTACDHMEEQISGTQMWGKHFLAARVTPRNPGNPEPSFWQIYASEDDTTINFDADLDVTGLPAGPQTLAAGELLELTVGGTVENPGDFEVQSDKPIFVMNYMIGSSLVPAAPAIPYSSPGDPAMVSVSPTEQFLPRYVMLVPPTWVQDVATITRWSGEEILLDGEAIEDELFIPVADTGLEVARVPVEDGVHFLDGDGNHFAVTIIGYDQFDSYAYLGGIGTGRINPPAG